MIFGRVGGVGERTGFGCTVLTAGFRSRRRARTAIGSKEGGIAGPTKMLKVLATKVERS